MIPSKVIPYLIQHGLLQAETVLDVDNVVVTDVSRRNRNFKVVSRSQPSYVVKHGDQKGGVGSVAYEASVYGLLRDHPTFKCFLPPMHGYDTEQRALTLGLVPNAISLREYHHRHRRFPTRFAALVGGFLAALHAIEMDAEIQGMLSTTVSLSPRIPEILSVQHPTLTLVSSLSAGNRQLVGLVQQTANFAELLDVARAAWRPSSLIHGDLRWDNCLVPHSSSRAQGLRVVDWEFAGIGDPCWDIGTVFGEYLGFWVLSMPNLPGVEVQRRTELASFPVERIQPAARAFWWTYLRQTQLDPASADEWLARAMAYAAAHLLELAGEQVHSASELTGSAVSLLQVGVNVLSRPREAALELLGIPTFDMALP